MGRVGRVVRVALPALLVLLVASGAWLAFSGARAVDAAADLDQAAAGIQQAIDDADIPALTSAAREAQDAAARADAALDDPVWAALAAIPYVGDTPQVARITASALTSAADGLDPLLDVAEVLDPASLVSDGRIDTDALQASAAPLEQAADTLDAAGEQLAQAPTRAEGAWVPASIDDQRSDAQDQLQTAQTAVATAATAAGVLAQLLGADEPRTWFIGLQTPAEARGTGGLAGNVVVLTANEGGFVLDRTASNTDFRRLPALPEIEDDYSARYGQDPRLFTNSNLSPDFPTAGLLWRSFYEDSFGRQADVVAGLDVAALGVLAQGTGPITLVDGTVVEPDEVVSFFLTDVYEVYPDRDERKQVQEAVAESVFQSFADGDIDAGALVSGLGDLVADGRLQIWSPVEDEQQDLEALGLAGALASADTRAVFPVVINASGSKLDTYLDRRIVYSVGRCPGEDRVTSTVDVTLTSALPRPLDVDPFVLGSSTGRPNAPVQRTQLQLHTSPGTRILQAEVDGEPVSSFGFTEQGRPSAVVEVDLPARKALTVRFVLDEVADQSQGRVQVQPLVRPADVDVVDAGCRLD